MHNIIYLIKVIILVIIIIKLIQFLIGISKH